jgi:hypothetical protein
MKTIVITLLLLAGILQAEAQQTPIVVTYNNSPVLAEANISHMPVARPLNTDRAMPIVQTDKTGYTMPVLGSKTPKRVYYMKRPTDTTKRVIINP